MKNFKEELKKELRDAELINRIIEEEKNGERNTITNKRPEHY